MRTAVLLCLVAGCAYKPGSFTYPANTFPGQRTTVGCLDLAMERRRDFQADAVLDFSFGNRCDHPTVVDFAGLIVVGRTSDGYEVPLSPYDPKGEIRTLSLDGRATGREAIAYPASAPIVQVCVDVAALAHAATSQWLCAAEPASLVVAQGAP